MTTDLDALRNLGAIRLGEPVPRGAKTIVVIGVARGGTSMVASVLERLGVFLGDQAAAPVFEDVRLASAIEAKDETLSRSIVDEYDAGHSLWAFKRPSLIDHLSTAKKLFRNPVYIVIFRDVLAIGNRNALSMKSDALKSMKQSLRQYEVVRQFVESEHPSALLVSNEKAVIHPQTFVGELVDWLGLEVSDEKLSAAADSIVVDHPQYLNVSRLQFLGRLDKATPEYVAGWAFIKGRNGPAKLEVRVNGQLVATIAAERHRPDVEKKGLHPTGFCRFRHAFEEGDGVVRGASVSVRFVLGGGELKASPGVVD
jgi:hypothetical protein